MFKFDQVNITWKQAYMQVANLRLEMWISEWMTYVDNSNAKVPFDSNNRTLRNIACYSNDSTFSLRYHQKAENRLCKVKFSVLHDPQAQNPPTSALRILWTPAQ